MKKLIMALVLVPMMALAYETNVGGVTWSYDVSGGKATVTGASPASGSITIPASLGGYPVTSIGDRAFKDCSGLTSVTIPSSVTSIGEYAFDVFDGCSGLTSISVAAQNQAYSSQDGLLYNKTKSELIFCPDGKTGAVTIPSSVTSIGDNAFEGCSGLTSVTIPSSVTSIGTFAFSCCSGLTSVTIPSGVTSIGAQAFSDCCALTSVTIPSSVTSIGTQAFGYWYNPCSFLKTIYVASGDAQRIKNMFSSSGEDMSGFRFVEPGTAGEWEGEDCGGDCSPGDEGDGGGAGAKDPFDGNEKHVFNGLVRDKKKSPCGLIQVTTAKATKKGVKVSGFVMLEDGKKVTMKAVTVAVDKKQLNVSTTVGKLGSISLTIGGKGFAGTLGDKKVASEKLDEDAGVLKTTVKVTYLDAATGKLKTKNMTLGGVAIPKSAAGVLTSKGSAAKPFQATVK